MDYSQCQLKALLSLSDSGELVCCIYFTECHQIIFDLALSAFCGSYISNEANHHHDIFVAFCDLNTVTFCCVSSKID